jgi:hypothetical protein
MSWSNVASSDPIEHSISESAASNRSTLRKGRSYKRIQIDSCHFPPW